jgi:hypothetical protein
MLRSSDSVVDDDGDRDPSYGLAQQWRRRRLVAFGRALFSGFPRGAGKRSDQVGGEGRQFMRSNPPAGLTSNPHRAVHGIKDYLAPSHGRCRPGTHGKTASIDLLRDAHHILPGRG